MSANRKFDDNAAAEKNAEIIYEPQFKDIYPQMIASMMAFFFSVQSGITMVYSNLLLDSMNTEQSSWFASVGIVTTPLGAIISGPLSDKIGRRNFHILIGIPTVISWIILTAADITEFHLLITARFLGGIGGGLCTASLVYVAEITHKNYRAMMLSLLSVYVSLGILITTAMGAFFDWKQTAIIFAVIFFVITIATILYIPESPYWLMNFGPKSASKARQSLKRLYRNQLVEEKEWETIENDYKSRKVNQSRNDPFRWKWSDPTIYKPLTILMLLMFLQQINGVYAALSYAKGIFSRITCKPMEQDFFTRLVFLALGIARFAMAVVTTILSKYSGRKPILMSSTGGMSVLCFALYILSYFDDDTSPNDTSNIAIAITSAQLCTLVLFLCYLGISSFGIMSVPWTLIPELLPVPFKSIGTSFLISYTYILYFVATKILPYVLENVRLQYVFLCFGVFSVLMTVFTYVYVPETYGKNVGEIAAYFTTEHRHQRRPVVIVNNDGDINDNSEHDVDDYNEENSLK